MPSFTNPAGGSSHMPPFVNPGTSVPSSILVFGQSNAIGENIGQEPAPSSTAVIPTLYTTALSAVSLAQNYGGSTYVTGPLQPRSGGTGDTVANMGIELSLGRQLAKVGTFNIIKYGVGSTSLAVDWAPGGTLLLAAMAFAVAAAASLGTPVGAVIWIQGEADAHDSTQAANYQTNLTALFAGFRAQWPNIPIVVQQLRADNVGTYVATIRAAEAAAVAGATHAALVDPPLWQLYDGTHFGASSYVHLGKSHATAVCGLLGLSPPADPEAFIASTNAASYTAGQTVTASWAGLTDTFNWINVVPSGAASNANLGKWVYSNGTQTPPSSQTNPTGSNAFVSPGAGTWVPRLMSDTTYSGTLGLNVMFEGAPFTVASGAGAYTGTVDGTSGWAVPATAGEWTSLLASTGISNPSLLWLCQEASSSLADSIGTFTATASGAPTYANAVTGWTRKAVKCGTALGASSAMFRSTAAGLPDISTTSFLAIAIIEWASGNASANPASALTLGPTFGSQFACDAQAATTPGKITANRNGGAVSGGTSVLGKVTYGTGTTVDVLIVQVDRTNGVTRVQTSNELLSASTLTGLTGKALALGGDNSQYWNAAGAGYLYVAGFVGAAAEMTATQLSTLTTLLRNGH